jgi:hypothetical protein
VAGRERQQRNIASTLDCFSQLALMVRTGTGNPARRYLAPLRDKVTQRTDIFVIYSSFLVGAETANFATAITPAGSTGTTSTICHDYISFFIVVD